MPRVVVLGGDGIGPEVIRQAVRVMVAVGNRRGEPFQPKIAPFGGEAIEKFGAPLPDDTLAACKESDAVLLGAIGGPQWDHLPGSQRPEAGLLKLRKELAVYANLRPARVRPPLAHISQLRPDIVERGVDLIVVRELTGGLYYGEPRGYEVLGNGTRKAFNTLTYSEGEIERVAVRAFEIARGRRKKVTSVDLANVLETGQLWREVVGRVAERYPDVEIEHMLVDNCAHHMPRDPSRFDVVLTENTFGDILSEEAAVLTGSIGILPSASVADGGPGIYEPVHGSAPKLAGKDVANPIAAIACVAMMMRHSFGMPDAAEAIETAIDSVLAAGYRTRDIIEPGKTIVGCNEMGELIAARL
jgi:3-isopropylmalate dehydrogenase